ncbi:hypothetical protein [Edaphovirga cremea]|uniref:hypothetical protein n=1 Tax=Edaphovirga cremea TaxID=2267246 RepID=UPI003989B6D8
MATQIGQAGSDLNLRLGLSPTLQDPKYATEFQLIYNALHLLGEYMDVLRANLESSPGQTPSESVRFRRTFWAPALQTIVAGSIISPIAGGYVNGVLSTEVSINPNIHVADTIGGTGSRTTWGITTRFFAIALTAAAPGELVQVGIGPGITQITGAKCGQLIWGVDSRSVLSRREANTAGHYIFGRPLLGNGGVYLDNITHIHYFTGGYSNYEGYYNPGYPNNSDGYYYSSVNFLYPVGVCVADGYVLFKDFVRSDSLPINVFT